MIVIAVLHVLFCRIEKVRDEPTKLPGGDKRGNNRAWGLCHCRGLGAQVCYLKKSLTQSQVNSYLVFGAIFLKISHKNVCYNSKINILWCVGGETAPLLI